MHWRKALKDMKPYTPGKSIEEVKEIYGLTDAVKLASNENPYGTAPAVQEYFKNMSINFEVYPDGYAGVLRTKMAAKLGVAEDRLIFGSGSDELIVIIARALLGPGTNSIVATPTFPQYAHHAEIEGAQVKEIPLVDGQHDLNGFLQAIDANTSVIWLCSPNNPTGSIINHEDLVDFLGKIPENILVVIDEAYFEYIVDPNYVNTIDLVDQFHNVIVLRTFSKAYGLAAFRVGYGISNSEIITNLDIVRSPFNITTTSLQLAEAALEDDSFIAMCRKLNREQMDRFKEFAEENNLHVFDSEANFMLIEVPMSATEATEKLLGQGYIVRSGDALGVPGYIRVTIGTKSQNDGFLEAFSSLIEGAGLEK
ncbi:histidinol-phosphate transaminase [Sporosarcina sp. Marseille-Q4063]|uniref:histidinol-phosphate transaminase n=1 Tax=Sporosarcina sp. Marseille-Q4063 TaxID=2810514 RepID=UPI001BAEBE47|nr:histidinol-phosphate transaminase [Sporosarcina sp. Marseille-Q4063]QUW22115.1 histidinol-phosphate transaminase [Sporosarcina sp. Marseille-Q4063]